MHSLILVALLTAPLPPSFGNAPSPSPAVVLPSPVAEGVADGVDPPGVPTPAPLISQFRWEPLSDQDGIKTFRRDVPGTSVVAFRGEAWIEAPIWVIAHILADPPGRKEWTDALVESATLKQFSQFHSLEYNQTAVPFPFQNRDFLFESKAGLSRKERVMTLELKSVVDPLKPEVSGVVRGDMLPSQYTLRASPDYRQTYLAVEIAVNPRGILPTWVVNLAQKKWPRNTILGIRKQAAKPGIGEIKALREYFTESAPSPTPSPAS